MERVAKKAGPIFVTLVILLTTSVVALFYTHVLPWNMQRWSSTATTINLVIGHWLLLNIVFNYYMGVTTSPGRPPHKVDSPVSICKNCIIPKPARTHHCSVCRRCVLKMDHHCPWLNNCVGHYNHRYFFLFCVYMCSGTIFVALSIFDQFRVYFSGTLANFLTALTLPLYSAFIATYTPAENGEMKLSDLPVMLSPAEVKTRFWVTYEFFLCVGVTIALGSLTVWHAKLIGNGETSIEKHINMKETKRMRDLGGTYKNPYDFGFKENWKVFFGIENGTGRSWRHVLLPSTHKPTGDGECWRTISSKSD